MVAVFSQGEVIEVYCQVCMITGAARGLGNEFCKAFIQSYVVRNFSWRVNSNFEFAEAAQRSPLWISMVQRLVRRRRS